MFYKEEEMCKRYIILFYCIYINVILRVGKRFFIYFFIIFVIGIVQKIFYISYIDVGIFKVW